MKNIISCEFNIDIACVELRFAESSMISIDCTAVKNEVTDNKYQQTELDRLLYNALAEYADLIYSTAIL